MSAYHFLAQHRVFGRRPLVEGSHNRNRFGVGCPQAESGAMVMGHRPHAGTVRAGFLECHVHIPFFWFFSEPVRKACLGTGWETASFYLLPCNPPSSKGVSHCRACVEPDSDGECGIFLLAPRQSTSGLGSSSCLGQAVPSISARFFPGKALHSATMSFSSMSSNSPRAFAAERPSRTR